MSYKVYVPKISASWDDYWTKKSIEDDLKLCATDELLPIFQKYLTKNMLAVEAGSGLGKWVITLKNLGYQIIGMDNYPKGLQRVKDYANNIEQIAADIACLPILDNSFDAYLSLGVVEHFESGPKPPLDEAYRALKPGGIAFIEVPFDNPLRKTIRFLFSLKILIKWPVKQLFLLLKLKKPHPSFETVFYEYHYTKKELLTFIKNSGFQLIKLYPKDDSSPNQSIGLWLDLIKTRHPNNKLFALNTQGVILKKILKAINPYIYSALIVAVVKKPR